MCNAFFLLLFIHAKRKKRWLLTVDQSECDKLKMFRQQDLKFTVFLESLRLPYDL